MKLTALSRIGLSDDQILTYTCLLENGTLSPPQLAAITQESRTNAYMSLKKLEQLGLAERYKMAKKLAYRPVSPAQLERLLNEQEQTIQSARSELQHQLPVMLKMFYANAAKPVVQFYEGSGALDNLLADQTNTGDVVYVVEPSAYNKAAADKLCDIQQMRSARGINTVRIGFDHINQVTSRTIPRSQPARGIPVEISIYGNNVAYLTFGAATTATIIESPSVAAAMMDLFVAAKFSAKATMPPLAANAGPAISTKRRQ